MLESIDALELNGEAVWIPKLTSKQANQKLIAFYADITKDFPHLGIIANSDGHSFHEIGKSYTLIKQPDTKNSETLTSTLRVAVKSSSLEDVHLQPSTIGAYEHLIKLIPLIFAAKLHLIKIQNPRGESHT